jgi:hypothetical protein
MANHKGSEGTVKVSSDVVAEIRGWEFTETAELIEDTNLGDAAKTFQSGNTGGSGSVQCFWDETNTAGQGAMTPGAQVSLNLFPEGGTTGDTYFNCNAVITSVQRSAAINGMVEVVFGWTANGAIAAQTAA